VKRIARKVLRLDCTENEIIGIVTHHDLLKRKNFFCNFPQKWRRRCILISATYKRELGDIGQPHQAEYRESRSRDIRNCCTRATDKIERFYSPFEMIERTAQLSNTTDVAVSLFNRLYRYILCRFFNLIFRFQLGPFIRRQKYPRSILC
jgi:hypothetical protein